MPPIKTPLLTVESHVAKWRDCRRCGYCETRTNVVLGRGTLKADICFIGEAPGDSEDATAQPFTGPAGTELDRIIDRALGSLNLTYAITNLVGCLPIDDGEKGQPNEEAIKACTSRLQEFVRLVDPKLIVCVGKMAKDWLEPGIVGSVAFHRDIPQVHIIHPAAIIRSPVAQRSLLVQRAAVTVYNAAKTIQGGASFSS
jgi:DNA polymerase